MNCIACGNKIIIGKELCPTCGFKYSLGIFTFISSLNIFEEKTLNDVVATCFSTSDKTQQESKITETHYTVTDYQRYKKLLNKYSGNLTNTDRIYLTRNKPKEYLEFLQLNNYFMALSADDIVTFENGKAPLTNLTEAYFLKLEGLYRKFSNIPADSELEKFIVECSRTYAIDKTLEEVKKDIIKVILGTWK